ncbi:Aste57867_22938 [Aphanomyces stellatus]|uniref:Aste57867_22938 protein n=1 Tax=Aphanomyces stellatus TaxID=120398 RepID=A0A485LN93_9STRA|nr:hypothetical protein As57867_022867 [Aphanomyces stellatus]VFT99588.1 Aste57867_22938 [Aphanomyces stellatus]
MGNLPLSRQSDLFWEASVLSLLGCLRASQILAAAFRWPSFAHWTVFGLVFLLSGVSFLASVRLLCTSPHPLWIRWLFRWPLWAFSAMFFVQTAASYAQSLCCCHPSFCPVQTSLLEATHCTSNVCADAYAARLRDLLSFGCSLLAIELVLYAHDTRTQAEVTCSIRHIPTS